MIIEKRILRADALMTFCQKKDLYTSGNNEEYENMLFNLADSKENITTNDIVEIATDILNHSDTDYELTCICFEIARLCVTLFEEV